MSAFRLCGWGTLAGIVLGVLVGMCTVGPWALIAWGATNDAVRILLMFFFCVPAWFAFAVYPGSDFMKVAGLAGNTHLFVYAVVYYGIAGTAAGYCYSRRLWRWFVVSLLFVFPLIPSAVLAVLSRWF